MVVRIAFFVYPSLIIFDDRVLVWFLLVLAAGGDFFQVRWGPLSNRVLEWAMSKSPVHCTVKLGRSNIQEPLSWFQRFLNSAAGIGNWWLPCNHERKNSHWSRTYFSLTTLTYFLSILGKHDLIALDLLHAEPPMCLALVVPTMVRVDVLL